ncbi:MAG: nitrile hydratase accessory protein [Sneathiellaceae bacterium]
MTGTGSGGKVGQRTPPSHPDMPPIPQDEHGPVFREPWEAQAFAMVLDLYDKGRFTWNEWVDTISGEIAAAKARGDPDLGDSYYRHWLGALEKLVAAKGLSTADEIAERKEAWRHADEHRDFGAPIRLHDHGHDHDH